MAAVWDVAVAPSTVAHGVFVEASAEAGSCVAEAAAGALETLGGAGFRGKGGPVVVGECRAVGLDGEGERSG